MTTTEADTHFNYCHDSRCLRCNGDDELRHDIEEAWYRYEQRVLAKLDKALRRLGHEA